jgi:hypothetical protein
VRSFEVQPETVNLIPETPGRTIRDGYRDPAGTARQVEPAHHLLRRSILELESPYWNPYTAGGTHGPEELAASRFSAISLATALLGAGPGALHAVLLSLFAVSIYFLFRTLTLLFGLTSLGSLAACFSYLLGGFHVSMLASQMVQPYLLAPILLYALLRLIDSPSAWRFVLATLATVLLLAETFVPTTLLTLLAIHSLCLAWGLQRHRWRARRVSGALLSQLAVSIAGFLLLAPLWFPILESQPHGGWEVYETRRFETVRPVAALSLITPKHFWESYAAFSRTLEAEDRSAVRHIDGTRVYHHGLVGLFLATCAFGASRRRRNPLLWTAALLVFIAWGRVFGLPPFGLLERVPVLGMLSVQYWEALAALSFCLLVGYGIDALSRETIPWWVGAAVIAATVGASLALLLRIGLPDAPLSRIHLAVLWGLTAMLLPLLVLLRLRPDWRRVFALCLLCLSVTELIFYMNRLRPVRERDQSPLVSFLQENLQGGGRVLNISGHRGLHPNWGSAFGIEQIDSLDGVHLSWYGSFFADRFGLAHHFLAIRPDGPTGPAEVRFDLNALSLLNGRFVVLTEPARPYRRLLRKKGFKEVFADSGQSVYENPEPLPRTFVVGALVEAPGIPSDRQLPPLGVATTTDRDFLAHAEGFKIPVRASGDIVPATPAGTAGITAYHHARVELEADLERPGVVVLADTWHPTWRVTVDGQEAVVGRVDEVLRGIALPPGRHRIVMTYRPRSLRAAQWVSLSTLGLLMLAPFAFARLGTRRTATGSA